MNSETYTYFIDANGLISFILEDDKETHDSVRKIFNKSNTGDNLLLTSTYVLGETFKSIISKTDNFYNEVNVSRKIKELRDLVLHKKRLKIMRIDDIDLEDLKRHYNELTEKDNRIQQGDLFNLAFFCSAEAKVFLTNDQNILVSNKINSYLNSLGKKILEFSDAI